MGWSVVVVVLVLGTLLVLRFGHRARDVVGSVRVSRERRSRPERRRLRVSVPVERRRAPRRQEEIAERFLRRLKRGTAQAR